MLGAGVAGLVAARDLQAAGARVRVLEATPRVGGRVRTWRDFADGSHGEAGGELLGKGDRRVLALLDELGLKRTRILRGGFRFWARGRDQGRHGWKELVRRLSPLEKRLRRAKGSAASAAAQEMGETSVEGWLAAHGMEEEVRRRVRSVVRGMLLGDPRRLSLWQLVQALTGEAAGGPTESFYRVRGGTDLLPRALADSLAEPPILGAAATRVSRGPRGVTVLAREEGRSRRFRASLAVVALPVPPLRRLEFAPELPAVLRWALRTIGFGPATKTVLRLDRRMNRSPLRGTAWGSDLPLGAFWDGAEEQPDASLVTILTGGDLSPPLARLPERQRVKRAAKALPMRSGARVLEGRSIVWERERFAGGGYATFDVGFPPRLAQALAMPLPRLVFAGEHTSAEAQGFIEGAVESGQRAAREARILLSRRGVTPP